MGELCKPHLERTWKHELHEHNNHWIFERLREVGSHFYVVPTQFENSPLSPLEIWWGALMQGSHGAKWAAWLDFCLGQASVLALSRARENVHSRAPLPLATQQLQPMAKLFFSFPQAEGQQHYRVKSGGLETPFNDLKISNLPPFPYPEESYIVSSGFQNLGHFCGHLISLYIDYWTYLHGCVTCFYLCQALYQCSPKRNG